MLACYRIRIGAEICDGLRVIHEERVHYTVCKVGDVCASGGRVHQSLARMDARQAIRKAPAGPRCWLVRSSPRHLTASPPRRLAGSTPHATRMALPLSSSINRPTARMIHNTLARYVCL